MAFLSSLNISASALTAQRFRMDVISENIANSDTITTDDGGPYKKKSVVFQEKQGSFSEKFNDLKIGKGVEVTQVKEDEDSFKLVYEPENELADENGYVKYPNVDKAGEMLDMMSASRSYQANVTVINAIKSMAASALQIGK